MNNNDIVELLQIIVWLIEDSDTKKLEELGFNPKLISMAKKWYIYLKTKELE